MSAPSPDWRGAYAARPRDWYVVEGLVRETEGQARAACRRYGYDPTTIRKIRGSLADAMRAASEDGP